MSAIVTRNIGVAARQWANRVSVRTVVIPGSHQEPLKEAAKRIGYWGEEQDIDSRYALMDKVNKQSVAHEYRFRRDGKGFNTEERSTYKDPTEGEEARRKPPE